MASRTKLTVAYLGGDFAGWQRQASVRTVQGELESALATVIGDRPVTLVGAGRTDAGVHAAGQVAHVDLPAGLPAGELARILNARLPWDVRIRRATAVGPSFHARIKAIGKHYRYRIRWRQSELPWRGLRAAVDRPPKHPDRLETGCRLLSGRRDWASFTVPEAADRGATRTVFRVVCRWRRNGLDLGFFGDGFVRYQVRRMVGALVAVGHGRLELDELRALVDSPAAGAPLTTAEARGLTLERVFYRRTSLLSPEPSADSRVERRSLW